MSTDAARLREVVLARIQAEPSSPRAVALRAQRAVLAVAFLGVVAELSTWATPQLGGRPFGFVALTSLAWLLSAGGVWATGLRRRSSMLGPPRAELLAVALGATLVPTAAHLLGNALWPVTRVASHEHPGLVCFDLSLSLAAWPLSALAIVRRGSDPVHPGALGAVVGAMAGAVSGLLVNLHCRYADPRHVLLGHVLPMALLIAVGYALGTSMMGVSGARRPAFGAAMGAMAGGWLGITLDFHLQLGCPDRLEPRELAYLASGVVLGALVGRTLARRIAAPAEG